MLYIPFFEAENTTYVALQKAGSRGWRKEIMEYILLKCNWYYGETWQEIPVKEGDGGIREEHTAFVTKCLTPLPYQVQV